MSRITEIKSIQNNEALFTEAYEIAFPRVASFIAKLGGNFEEAKDIFQDALVIYYEKIVIPDRTSEIDKAAYIAGIAKHLWYRKYHNNKRFKSLQGLAEPEEISQEPEVSPAILKFIEKSGKKCLELLRSFYYDKLNMRELSDKFGFSGERSATAQKFKCLEKIRTVIKQRSLNKEDFYE